MNIAMKYLIKSLAIAAIFYGCSKSGSSKQTGSTPAASISNVTDSRSTTDETYKFTVTLNAAASTDVTIHYTTADGSALQNKDYVPASGVLTITAGKLTGDITVTVKGDSTRQADQAFTVQLSDAQHCTLANNQGTGYIINADGLYYPVDTAGYRTPDHYPGYSLAWSDEFTGSTINTTTWNFEIGNNGGWGNHELETYTNSTQNAFVSNGNLIIEARQQSSGSSNTYTSARMTTKGKQRFQFGRVDIRAKLPSGKGVWPALWMLGDNIDAVNWPACGEIDIMELLGQTPNTMYGTLHWGADFAQHQSKGTNYVLASGAFSDKFHVYSMVWVQDTVKLLVDDQAYLTVKASDVSPNPFNSKFFFIFNVAVGGDWPGPPDGTTGLPQRMVVDYVRVFQ